MKKEQWDIYTDDLISQNHYATTTGLSDLLGGEISHDQVIRFLSHDDYNSQELWEIVKPTVHHVELDDNVLCLDDTIAEKTYTDENDIICRSHAKNRTVKGVNLLSCMV